MELVVVKAFFIKYLLAPLIIALLAVTLEESLFNKRENAHYLYSYHGLVFGNIRGVGSC